MGGIEATGRLGEVLDLAGEEVGLLRGLGGEVDLVSSSNARKVHGTRGNERDDAGEEMRDEYARVEVRVRISRMATPDFWQTCLANCWREFLSLICQNL
jgi:hypothetical protein